MQQPTQLAVYRLAPGRAEVAGEVQLGIEVVGADHRHRQEAGYTTFRGRRRRLSLRRTPNAALIRSSIAVTSES